MLVTTCSVWSSFIRAKKVPDVCFCYIRSSRTYAATSNIETFSWNTCSGPSLSVKCCLTAGDDGKHCNRKEGDDRKASRRDIILNSVNLAIFGSSISADGTTIVNSILGT